MKKRKIASGWSNKTTTTTKASTTVISSETTMTMSAIIMVATWKDNHKLMVNYFKSEQWTSYHGMGGSANCCKCSAIRMGNENGNGSHNVEKCCILTFVLYRIVDWLSAAKNMSESDKLWVINQILMNLIKLVENYLVILVKVKMFQPKLWWFDVIFSPYINTVWTKQLSAKLRPNHQKCS